MPYTYATPAAQPAAIRPPDDAMVADAAQMLRAVAAARPDGGADRTAYRLFLVRPLARLCQQAKRRRIPVERLIIAIKHARATLPETRRWLVDAEEDGFADIITVCIEQYFAAAEHPLRLRRPT